MIYYLNQWKFADNASDDLKKHSMESKDLGPGYETEALSRKLKRTNLDRLVEAVYWSTT